MAIKFQLRGNSLDAYYAAAWKGHAVAGGNDANVPINASAISGVFGGFMLDMSQKKPLCFQGGDNWTAGSNQFTVLMRIVPNWTGVSSFFQDFLLAAFTTGATLEGAFLGYNVSDNTYAVAQNRTGAQFLTGDYSGAIPFVQNIPIDLWYVSKGGTGVGQFEVWYAPHGSAPTKVLNATLATAALVRSMFLSTSLSFGSAPGHNSDYSIVEAVVWDDVQDPSSFGIRAGFITVPGNIEGYAQSDPGVANVVAPNTYVSQGVSKTGTSIRPAASDVKLGVAVGATTGTAIIPAAADVRFGTATGGTTGTLRVPSPALVVQGTATDNTVGTLTFYNPPATPGLPATCIVSIDVPHIMGYSGVTSAKIRARPAKAFEHTDQLVPKEWFEATLDSSGHGTIELVETESLSPSVKYEFQLVYVLAGETKILKYKPVAVPTTGTANLLDLSNPL